MIDSYNARIMKLMRYSNQDVLSWVLVDNNAVGTTQAVISMKTGERKTIDIARYALDSVLKPNEAGYVLIDRDILDDIVHQFPGGLEGFQRTLAEASGIDLDNESALFSDEFGVTLLAWAANKVFVPASEITVTDISTDDDVIQYTKTLTKGVLHASIVQANANSLGYNGSIKLIEVSSKTAPPTVDAPEPELNLDHAETNEDTGEYVMMLTNAADDLNPQLPDILARLHLDFIARGISKKLNTYELTTVVTNTDVGGTITITPTDTSPTSPVVGQLIVNIIEPPVGWLDLNTITNSDIPGTWLTTLDGYYVQGRPVPSHLPVDEIVTAINTAHSTTISFYPWPQGDILNDDVDIYHLHPNPYNESPNVFGVLTVKVTWPDVLDLDVTTNIDVPGEWFYTPSEYEMSGISYKPDNPISQQVKVTIANKLSKMLPPTAQGDSTTIDRRYFIATELPSSLLPEGHAGFTLSVAPPARNTVRRVTGSMIVTYVAIVRPLALINLSEVTNCGKPGIWEYAVADPTSVTAEEEEGLRDVIWEHLKTLTVETIERFSFGIGGDETGWTLGAISLLLDGSLRVNPITAKL